MKKTVGITFWLLFILGGCSTTLTQEEIYTKNIISISELESSLLASGLSFTLLPIDGFTISPSPTDEYNIVGDFLFVDYINKEVGIHFADFMPDKRNNQREQHMNDMEIPYENIYPPLKYLYINEKEREKLPDYYDLLDIPEYSKTYFKEQLGTEIIPFYYQPIKEADFESFILWTGWIYASDKNNVYILFRYDVPMLDIDILNYKVFEKNGIIQYPFYNIIKGANSKEGNKINNPFYLVQNNGVRYKGIKLTEINPFNKIIYHGSGYLIQNEGVWFGYTKIPEADSTTFQIIKDYPQYGLAIDSKYVYINADKETKENIKKHWSLGRCEYETLFEQIKDNPLYEANILVELMKETNTMEDFYKNERCALGISQLNIDQL